ncbi:hypothetical protein M0811_03669 [Anaeramoeba ignava]|uniref:Uncharacterized protein n=1 Tax=Anaeramoeba ignava TaxID=1746090 RepID=A0A9Q0LWT9_ANAIG|nr:hypothetical protein M0811_03669 [Anaeramoeba ignava]
MNQEKIVTKKSRKAKKQQNSELMKSYQEQIEKHKQEKIYKIQQAKLEFEEKAHQIRQKFLLKKHQTEIAYQKQLLQLFKQQFSNSRNISIPDIKDYAVSLNQIQMKYQLFRLEYDLLKAEQQPQLNPPNWSNINNQKDDEKQNTQFPQNNFRKMD